VGVVTAPGVAWVLLITVLGALSMGDIVPALLPTPDDSRALFDTVAKMKT